VTVETCTTFGLFDCDLTTLASAPADKAGYYELTWTDLVACFDGSRLGQYHLTVKLPGFVEVERSASLTCTEELQEIHFVMEAFPVVPTAGLQDDGIQDRLGTQLRMGQLVERHRRRPRRGATR
jgi:hypothetical protein